MLLFASAERITQGGGREIGTLSEKRTRKGNGENEKERARYRGSDIEVCIEISRYMSSDIEISRYISRYRAIERHNERERERRKSGKV